MQTYVRYILDIYNSNIHETYSKPTSNTCKRHTSNINVACIKLYQTHIRHKTDIYETCTKQL